MFNRRQVRRYPRLHKDLIGDASWDHINLRINTAGVDFVEGSGLGHIAAESSTFFCALGGVRDQKMTAELIYSGESTSAGNEDLGVVLRNLTTEESEDTYYYFRVDGGQAKITRVVDLTFVTLTRQAFNLQPNTPFTIVAQARGDELSATFNDGTNEVSLSAIDTVIPSGGSMGFKTISSSIFVREFTAEEI